MYQTNLATIVDSWDMDHLWDLWKANVKFRNLWIGLYETARYGEKNRDGWAWTSGINYYSTSSLWRPPRQPDNVNNKCGMMFGRKRAKAYDDAPCRLRAEFACDSPNHTR
jgi:hypothetical protein